MRKSRYTKLTESLLGYLDQNKKKRGREYDFVYIEKQNESVLNIGDIKFPDHSNDNRFGISNCTYGTVKSNNFDFSMYTERSTIKNLDIKGGKFAYYTMLDSKSNKVEKGHVSNFTSAFFRIDNISFKDVTFENGNKLEIRGEAIRLRNIKIKNVKDVTIYLSGKCGKISIEIENCQDVWFRCDPSSDITFEQVIIKNSTITSFRNGIRSQKIVVKKVVIYKCKFSREVYDEINNTGTLKITNTYGDNKFTDIKTALKVSTPHIIYIT